VDLALSIDVGASKIALGLIDTSGGVVRRARIRTPLDRAADEIWAMVAAAATELLTTARSTAVVGIGIGSAGPLDPVAGTVSPNMISAWRSFPIVERAGGLVVGVPVRLIGDGICATIGEHWVGAGRAVRNMLGVVVSSGIGGGLVLDGVVRAGPTGNAGHVGHVVLAPDGPQCPCGGRGCAETIGSGPSMVAWAVQSGWGCGAGCEPTAAGLAAAARVGDPIARAAFAHGGRAVAAMIASVAAVCDLDLVVVGGGVAASGDVLFEPVRASLEEFAGLGFVRRIRVEPALLGGDAGLIGAAALLHCPDSYDLRLQ
jgi:glucokinase